METEDEEASNKPFTACVSALLSPQTTLTLPGGSFRCITASLVPRSGQIHRRPDILVFTLYRHITMFVGSNLFATPSPTATAVVTAAAAATTSSQHFPAVLIGRQYLRNYLLWV